MPPAALCVLRPPSVGGQAGPSNIDAGAGSQEEIARIVAQVSARWPSSHLLRADSRFAGESLLASPSERRRLRL